MEEAQVASPIFIHQSLAGRFGEARSMAKKRDLYSNYHQQHRFQQQQQQQRQNPSDAWNPNAWNWDSVGFVAKSSLKSDGLRLGTAATPSEQKKGGEMQKEAPQGAAEDESLRLKLGGSLSPAEQAPTPAPLVSRPSKRVRSGSPGAPNYPMCQVDDCREDLSNGKDYHRRHKVCEVHSKSTRALVGNQMQRFCQQCSRFHPLSEFDEGKRSCRRRLAGHNRRRRKTQPDDVTSRLSLPAHQDNSGCGNLDIVNLLTALARAQGNANVSSIPDKERLIQILGKIKSLPLPSDIMAKLPISGSLAQNVPLQASSENQNKSNGNTHCSSTMNLLPVLSATIAASSPEALGTTSQSSQSNDCEKNKPNSANNAAGFNFQERSTLECHVQREKGSTELQSLVDDSDCRVREYRSHLPLQLFSSSPEGESPPSLPSTRKYFSSDSSNPMEDRSPSCSPPVEQKLFPMQTLTEAAKHEKVSASREANVHVEASRSQDSGIPLQLFREPTRGAYSASCQSFPQQAGYTSSSGSDHSPASLNSDAQDRTGRIMFKLFDKDPSHFPGNLRTEIYRWLSHSPSEMESYIRPGCVVLSIYLSMSSVAWDQLEENLMHHVNSLVQDSDSEFWRNGRFLVHNGRQLASHKDGNIRLCKSWRSWKTPELLSVSPLAVVTGQETALLLRGRNLTTTGTRIHYTYMGGYKSKEASELTKQGSLCDDVSFDTFKIEDAATNVLGRCFIEVENGFKGNSFPIIIADAAVCQELRLLEPEFDETAKACNTSMEDHGSDLGRPRPREEVLHFLNELGWLFQRTRFRTRLDGPDYKPTRFKYLLTFSIERNFCALVKTLLDIFVERSLGVDGLSGESLEALTEIHPLNRAVKMKNRKMVHLLIHYSVTSSNDSSKKYVFPPNYTGPGGITPLHLAASMSGVDDLIDALTSDPQEIGLQCWNELLDANGLSPYAYALMRNNHSYNGLVARKLADKRNGQISVSVGNEVVQQDPMVGQLHRLSSQSCARCSVLSTNRRGRISGSSGLLQRPYIHFMLAIAAVCACVCLFFRALDNGIHWESIGHGTI